MHLPLARLATAVVLLLPAQGIAQDVDSLTAPYPADRCAACAGWNVPRAPFRIFGNTYYVGTEGLSAVLVTSPDGHVLIDGGLPASAPHILANVRTLGFQPADIRMILNSHAHYDHAGGIAAIRCRDGEARRRTKQGLRRSQEIQQYRQSEHSRLPVANPRPKVQVRR